MGKNLTEPEESAFELPPRFWRANGLASKGFHQRSSQRIVQSESVEDASMMKYEEVFQLIDEIENMEDASLMTRCEENFRQLCSNDGKYVVPFWGRSSPFSNHYQTEGQFSVDSRVYECVERFYMLMKAVLFGDAEMMKRMLRDPSRTMAGLKRLGRRVKGFRNEVWDVVGPVVMLVAAHAKFTQNARLAQMLLKTGDSILVEASPYDLVWGAGLNCYDPLLKEHPETWPGENRLGVVLMVLREYMRKQVPSDGHAEIDESKIPSRNQVIVKQLADALNLFHTAMMCSNIRKEEFLKEYFKNALEMCSGPDGDIDALTELLGSQLK